MILTEPRFENKSFGYSEMAYQEFQHNYVGL